MTPEQNCVGKLIIQKDWQGKQHMLFVMGILTVLSLTAIAAFIGTLLFQDLKYITFCGLLMILLWVLLLGWSSVIDYYDRINQLKKSFEVPDKVYLELKYSHRILRILAVSLLHSDTIEQEKEIPVQ